MSEFDFDIEETEIDDSIELDSSGNPLPPKNGLIALIDADTLIFATCLNQQYIVDVLPKEMYTENEWQEVINYPTYNKEDATIAYLNVEVAYEEVKDRIKEILDRTGCKDYELHFTGGNRDSFRYDYYPEYKANRKNSGTLPPAGLNELKKYCCEHSKGEIHYKWEADDIVVTKRKLFPDKYMLVAVDKDVLFSLEGTHFNYYSSSKYEIDMKFVEVDADTAMKHHYMQTLTGDPSDNVPGLHRVGKKTAEKYLKDCKTHKECWDKVIEVYEDKGKDVVDAIVSMRLVNMHQLILEDGEYKVELWKPQY